MGLGRWWMTHGPGSVGSIAKRMAISYSLLRRKLEGASHEELLWHVLRTRYNVVEIPDDEAARMVAAANGHLADLTLQVIKLENPHASTVALRAPAVHMEMLSIVREVTEKHAPGA